eukprot:6057628-Amphidinium_carterae.1
MAAFIFHTAFQVGRNPSYLETNPNNTHIIINNNKNNKNNDNNDNNNKNNNKNNNNTNNNNNN